MTTTVELDLPARMKGCCAPMPTSRLAAERADGTAAIFKALADPTRVEMLHFLKAADEPICVCDFTSVFDLGQPTVSHHLGKLREAGFVVSEKRGVWAFYSLRDDMPGDARAALALIP